MTTPTSSRWLRLAFLAGLLPLGLPYWLTPYSQLGYEILFTPGLALLPLAAFVLRLQRTDSFWRTPLYLGMVPLAVVMARVLVDGFMDPTSHNLWPFEAILAFLIGMVATLPGAFLGSAIGWVKGKPFLG